MYSLVESVVYKLPNLKFFRDAWMAASTRPNRERRPDIWRSSGQTSKGEKSCVSFSLSDLDKLHKIPDKGGTVTQDRSEISLEFLAHRLFITLYSLNIY
jgi:hypothetical protein